MRAILVILGLALLAPSARAADITITIPAAIVADAGVLCEALRVQLVVRAAEWTNKQCAEEFLRRGLRSFKAQASSDAARAAAVATVKADIATFDGNFPVQTPAACGDGTLDTEFGEQCDDGNTTSGDGCSAECFIEP